MLKTMTILWVTMQGGPLEGDTFGIPYLTEEACRAAMTAVGDTLGYDYSMTCETLPISAELEP